MTNVMNQKQTVVVCALLGAALLAGCSHQDQTSNGPQVRAGIAPQDPQVRADALAALKAQPSSVRPGRAPQGAGAREAALAALQAQQPH